MKVRLLRFAAALLLSFAAGIISAAAQSNSAVTTAPVFVPDTSRQYQMLPEGIISWDGLLKTMDATNEQPFAHATISFTNITTNVLMILNVHPSCGCTTAELPPVPWTIPPGTNGLIKLKIDLAGKTGMVGMLFKSVSVTTDQGRKDVVLRINVLPPPPMPEMTQAQRDAGVAAAKVDRQAVFKGDCASCHLKKVEGKYGQQLFDALCAVCHETQHRSTMVPDLHNLKVPTNEDFWRAWITAGKAGTLMPAFATSQGGPLNDMQISSLAVYLNVANPSHVPPPAAQ